MVILDMSDIVQFVNNINKRLNSLVNRVTKRAVKVKNNKPNYVKPTKNACHSEFGTGEKLKNTLQALQKANSPNNRDKFKRATDCLSYNNIGNTGQQLLLENIKEKNKATTNGKVSANVNPSQADCEKEFDNNSKLKNTLQELTSSASPNVDKLARAKACLAYKNTMKKNTSGAIIVRNNRNTVSNVSTVPSASNKPGNNTKKNANAKGYYKILGFNPPYNTISAKALSNAYHKLSLEAHPNKQSQKGLTVDPELFKKLQEAFEYLKDPDKRSVYNGKKTLKSLTNETKLLLKNNTADAKQWTKYSHGTNTWYTNKKEPISVWEKNLPKNAIIDEKPPEFWIVGESQDKSWLKLKDEYDHTMFYNEVDDISSWESPVGIEIKDLPVRKRISNSNIELPDPPQAAAGAGNSR